MHMVTSKIISIFTDQRAGWESICWTDPAWEVWRHDTRECCSTRGWFDTSQRKTAVACLVENFYRMLRLWWELVASCGPVRGLKVNWKVWSHVFIVADWNLFKGVLNCKGRGALIRGGINLCLRYISEPQARDSWSWEGGGDVNSVTTQSNKNWLKSDKNLMTSRGTRKFDQQCFG